MISSCYHDSEEGCRKCVPGLGCRLWIRVCKDSEARLCHTLAFENVLGD